MRFNINRFAQPVFFKNAWHRNLAIIFLVLLSGCSSSHEIEERVRHYFSIPINVTVNSEAIQSAILRDLSQGTSAEGIYDYLDKKGIGQDGLSAYYPMNQAGEIVCRIEFNAKTFGFVKKSYVVVFIMENMDQLKNVRVQENLTGL